MGETHAFSGTKVPRQCPLVLLPTIGSDKVRRSEVEKADGKVGHMKTMNWILLH
jgi:hypothetical protein